ncbi:MAG: hypothetical protein ABEJ64_04145 [Candidatus Nanohaloarchaea archaeon]
MISIQTWISGSRKLEALTALFFIAVIVPFASAQISGGGYYPGDGGGPITGDGGTGFSIPQYDSQMEIATDFVAPFLLITLVFQIGLERALMFTLAEDRNAWLGRDPNYKRERKKIKKRSLILALVITGMLVPTPFFRSINDLIAVVFGGSIYLMTIIAGIAALYFLVSSIGGVTRRGE